MERRPFGRTGLEVSAIGFGCWEIGGGYGRIEESAFARAVGRALDLALGEADVREIDAAFARHGVNPVPDRWVEDG